MHIDCWLHLDDNRTHWPDLLETDYPSRRIIRHTDNPSKYKPEDEF